MGLQQAYPVLRANHTNQDDQVLDMSAFKSSVFKSQLVH